jgi:hypothetical protein
MRALNISAARFCVLPAEMEPKLSLPGFARSISRRRAIVGERWKQRRADRVAVADLQQRIAVGRGRLAGHRRLYSACARAVIDRELYARALGNLAGHKTKSDIANPSCGERKENTDRLLRILCASR